MACTRQSCQPAKPLELVQATEGFHRDPARSLLGRSFAHVPAVAPSVQGPTQGEIGILAPTNDPGYSMSAFSNLSSFMAAGVVVTAVQLQNGRVLLQYAPAGGVLSGADWRCAAAQAGLLLPSGRAWLASSAPALRPLRWHC